MAWSDISRKVWSYIIAKLGVFTNVDPSRLEVSSNSLSLNNIDIDTARFECPGITITQCVVGKLILELSSSGFSINATELDVNLRIDTFEPPDLTISVILENTRSDLAELGSLDDPIPQQSQSGLVGRLADIALSQISARVSKINMTIEVPNSSPIHLAVSEAFMSSKHHIEFEGIAINRKEHHSEESDGGEEQGEQEESLEDDNGTEEEGTEEEDKEEDDMDIMSKSLYIDAQSSLRIGSKDIFVSSSSSSNQCLLALIDRITFTYGLEPVTFSVETERMRVDGMQMLETLVAILNVAMKSGDVNTKKSNTESQTSDVDGARFSVKTLEIYESLESGCSPIKLSDIHYQFSSMKIDSLNIPGITQVSPFLSVDFSDKALLTFQMPISASISLAQLAPLKRICEQALYLLSELEPPLDAEPASFTMNLPDIRISIGPELIVNLFPQRFTEQGIQLREVTAKVGDSQLVVSGIEYNFSGSAKVESSNIKASWKSIDELKLIASMIFDTPISRVPLEIPSDIFSGSYNKNEENKLSPPGIDISLGHLDYSYAGKNAEYVGSAEFKYYGLDSSRDSSADSSAESTLRAKFSGRLRNVETDLEIIATSNDCLKSVSSRLFCRSLNATLDPIFLKQDAPEEQQEETGSVSKASLTPVLEVLPKIDVELIFESMVEVSVTDETKLLLGIDNSAVMVSPFAISANIPKIYIDLIDPTDGSSRVTILKLKGIEVIHNTSLKVGADSVALITCADSYNYLNKLLETLMPLSMPPRFQTEPAENIDVFRDIMDRQFIPSNLSDIRTQDFVASKSEGLNIQEEYMGKRTNDTTRLGIPHILEASALWCSVDMSCFTIKRFKWHLYDGFDFCRTRERMKEAIKQVAQVAANLDVSPAKEEETPFVGDFMYNSVLIAAPRAGAEELRANVANELGSTSSLERSSDPKLLVSLRKIQIDFRLIKAAHTDKDKSQLSFSIRDGNIRDLVSTSRFSYMLSPLEGGGRPQDLVRFVLDTVGPRSAPELRSRLALRPVRLCLDQDTVEFAARFFQFSAEDDGTESERTDSDDEQEDDASWDSEGKGISGSMNSKAENPTVSSSSSTVQSSLAFIQRFEFEGLPIVIDYTPKKVDFRSLRSGMAAELLNLFAVKGAKVTLQPAVIHGVSGWDALLVELLDQWLPDIRENQLFGLIAGISPIRRAVKVSKGFRNYTIVPIKQKQITKGAGVVVRRTFDELMRIGSNWLDSTDKALGGS